MKKFTLAVVAALSLTLTSTGCGGGVKTPETDYAAARTVVRALAAEKALDGVAVDALAAATAGSVPLQQSMDALSAQTGELLALIEEVAALPRARDSHLASAQERLKTYLRERVFQIESALGAASPQEAQAAYGSAKATLDMVRDDVRGMLFAYDPKLKKGVP